MSHQLTILQRRKDFWERSLHRLVEEIMIQNDEDSVRAGIIILEFIIFTNGDLHSASEWTEIFLSSFSIYYCLDNIVLMRLLRELVHELVEFYA